MDFINKQNEAIIYKSQCTVKYIGVHCGSEIHSLIASVPICFLIKKNCVIFNILSVDSSSGVIQKLALTRVLLLYLIFIIVTKQLRKKSPKKIQKSYWNRSLAQFRTEALKLKR